MVVGAPDLSIFSPPVNVETDPKCGQLEADGKNGGIDLVLCLTFAEQVFDICECGPASEAGLTDPAVPVESPIAPVARV